MAELNRKAILNTIVWGLDLIDKSGKSATIYKDRIMNMTDKELEHLIQQYADKKDFVGAIYNNLEESPITTANNLAIAKQFSVEFFQRVWIPDPKTGTTFLTNDKHLVVNGRFRRQIQMLSNKMSVANDNRVIDDLTDQPVGDSKGASNSYPETLVLVAQGHKHSIVELMKYRGGDRKGFSNMTNKLVTTGQVSLSELGYGETRAKSTVTLSVFLKGMHLQNNL